MSRLSYWTHRHNWRYEAVKRIERAWLWLAMRAPVGLRTWIVVDATNTARRLYPDPTGYAGPDGLTYREIYDGALRERTGSREPSSSPASGG